MATKSLDVSKAELEKAVEGLQKLMKMTNKKSDILQEREKIQIQVGMKKIPNLPEQTININLPHGLFTQDTDVCLFVKDLDKTSREFELTEDHFKDMLVDKGVSCIRKIVPLKALKLEYKPYEAKRNLSNEFDLFLADARIIRLLPSQLGKHFYGRKRIPIQVDLEAKNLKEEIMKAVNNTRCVIKNRGSSCLMTVGHSGMSRDQIVENILKTVEQLSKKFPGGTDNIRCLYVKTTSSTSLPFFVSLDSGDSVVFPQRKKQKKASVVGDVTTVMDKRVKVMVDGTVKLMKSSEEGGKKKNRKRKNGTKTEEGVTAPGEEVEVKEEYDSQEDNIQEPASKKVKKTPKKKSASIPNSVKTVQKLQKTPKKSLGDKESKVVKSAQKSQKKTTKKSPQAVEAKNSMTPQRKTPGMTGIKTSVEKENQKSGKKKQNVNNTPAGKAQNTPKLQSAKKGRVGDVVIKQEDSIGNEMVLQTPASAKKSKAKTPKSKSQAGIPTGAGKGQGKTPKSATMEKAAKKLKEITPPTVKRLQSKAKVLTPDTPSRKQKKK